MARASVGRLRMGLPRLSLAANDSAIVVARIEPMFPGVDGVERTGVVARVAVGFELHPAASTTQMQTHADRRVTRFITSSDAASWPIGSNGGRRIEILASHAPLDSTAFPLESPTEPPTFPGAIHSSALSLGGSVARLRLIIPAFRVSAY